MPVFLTVEMIMRLLGFGGPSTSSPSVTEYNVFGFSMNEIGTGPVGLAVAALVIILPLICVGCCINYCCCSCACFSKIFCCCKKNKDNRAPDVADKKAGWRRCFFPCTKKKPSPPTLPILMQDIDTYESVYRGSIYSSGSIYSDPGSTRGGRTSRSSRSGRSRRRLPALPEDSSAYSSAPQITEVTTFDTGSTISLNGKHPMASQDETKMEEPKKDTFNIPTHPRIL